MQKSETLFLCSTLELFRLPPRLFFSSEKTPFLTRIPIGSFFDQCAVYLGFDNFNLNQVERISAGTDHT
jgi:hypothetical protein